MVINRQAPSGKRIHQGLNKLASQCGLYCGASTECPGQWNELALPMSCQACTHYLCKQPYYLVELQGSSFPNYRVDISCSGTRLPRPYLTLRLRPLPRGVAAVVRTVTMPCRTTMAPRTTACSMTGRHAGLPWPLHRVCSSTSRNPDSFAPHGRQWQWELRCITSCWAKK